MRSVSVLLIVVILGSCERAELSFADGSVGRYSDWDGRWIVINYWAEWCAPCRYEIPELNELADEHHGEVLVVGVNYDGVVEPELRGLIQRMGIEFPVLQGDPQAHFAYDRPSVLPTTILIDPQGQVLRPLVGPQTRAALESKMGVENAM